MNYMIRSMLGLLMLALMPISGCAESSARSKLHGSWTHVKLEHSADGKISRTYEAFANTTMVFRPDGTWQLTSPGSTSNGTYRWLNDKSIESKILASNMNGQAGTSTIKQVEIDGATLRLSTPYGEAAIKQFTGPDGKRPTTMTVISTFTRAVAAQ